MTLLYTKLNPNIITEQPKIYLYMLLTCKLGTHRWMLGWKLWLTEYILGWSQTRNSSLEDLKASHNTKAIQITVFAVNIFWL